MRVWIAGDFDRMLADKEITRLYTWLEQAHPYDDPAVIESGFSLGWVTWQQKEALLEELAGHLPADVSVSLELDYEDYGGSEKECLFLGPRAVELEVAHLDKEIATLVARKAALLAKEN